MTNGHDSILILGIGGAGAKVISHLFESGACGFELAAVDTDKNALDGLIGRAKCVLAGSAWRDGSGCGGDAIRGEQAVARERQAVTALLKGKRLVVTVGGLGGGVATGGVRTIASVAKALSIPSVFLLTTPFSFESFARRKLAEECLDELRRVTDVVLRIPNDLLFSMLHPDTPILEAYAESCAELARTALGIAGMLSGESAFQTDYAGFMAAVRGRRCSCGAGVGVSSSADGPDRCSVAVERMLESPFLGGVEKLSEADAAILCLAGNASLTLGETKRCLENLSTLFRENAMLMNGTNFSDAFADRVQVTVIAIRYEDGEISSPAAVEDSSKPLPLQILEPMAAKPRSTRSGKSKVRHSPLEQGEFELQSYSKGIYAGIAPSLYAGEDLDIPTFQRHGIVIDKGIVVR